MFKPVESRGADTNPNHQGYSNAAQGEPKKTGGHPEPGQQRESAYGEDNQPGYAEFDVVIKDHANLSKLGPHLMGIPRELMGNRLGPKVEVQGCQILPSWISTVEFDQPGRDDQLK